MEFSSTYKMLFLFNLLLKKPYTKAEIIHEFELINIKITKSLVTNYINRFIKNNINVKNKINPNREKVYYLEKKEINLNFSQKEFGALNDIKKILISQKNYKQIRKLMRLFYKIATFIKNEDDIIQLVNFGYYSKLNWNLVRQLEEHCKNKDIITIDYFLPKGGNKEIAIHVDSIKASEWSERIYLNGVLKGAVRFSHLPIDRIYMVKKVERKNCRFNLLTKLITYTTSKEAYEQAPKDEREKINKIENEKITLSRPIDDEFNITQRLFYFCPDLYYVSDEKIKKALKEKLEILKYNYDDAMDR